MAITQEFRELMISARPDIELYEEITICDNENGEVEIRDEAGALLAPPFHLNFPLSERDVEAAFAEAARFSNAFTQRNVDSLNASSYDPLREIGAMLYRGLFEGRRHVMFERKVEAARNRGAGVRLNFNLDNERLADLPWEILHDDNNFISLSSTVQVARRLPNSTARDYEPLNHVNVLVVALDDSAETLVRHIDTERQRVAESSPSALETKVLVISAEDLPSQIGSLSYDLLHIVSGYEFMRRNRRDRRNGRANSIRLLRDSIEKQHPRLVVLQTANSEHNARMLAPECGAVVTVRDSVSEQAKNAFADGLYRSLFTEHTIDQAVAAARQEIDLQIPGSREWGVPRYYRPPVTRLPLLKAPAHAVPESTESGISSGNTAELPTYTSPTETASSLDKREQRRLQVRLHMAELNLEALQKQALDYREIPALLMQQIEETKNTIADIQSKLQ